MRKPHFFVRCLLALLWVFVGASCSQPTAVNSPSASSATPTASPEISQPLSTPDAAVSTSTGVVLKIWLPPQFDVNQDNPAALLLRQRLDQFMSENPGVSMDIRIKAETGPGGMMESFSTASLAAPLALPDLVAMPRNILEQAALKGYLRQLDGLISAPAAADWYEYSLQLSRIQNSMFGIPFAGDALVMVYRPDEISQPPQDWLQTLNISATIGFPASDPVALFTLAQYLAAGGQVQDDQGRPVLDEQTLIRVLNFYQQASLTGRMPFWLAQYETDQQSWEAWQQGQTRLDITWVSRVLQNSASMSAAPIPTVSGPGYTLASGWVWALANTNRNAQHAELALRLAEYLCDPLFLGSWTEQAGYLPTRTGAYDAWTADFRQKIIEQVLSTARAVPSANILAVLGPGLRQSAVAVLRQQMDPNLAAQTAVKLVSPP